MERTTSHISQLASSSPPSIASGSMPLDKVVMVGEGLVFLNGSRACPREKKEVWEGEGERGGLLPRELDDRRAESVVDSLW